MGREGCESMGHRRVLSAWAVGASPFGRAGVPSLPGCSWGGVGRTVAAWEWAIWAFAEQTGGVMGTEHRVRPPCLKGALGCSEEEGGSHPEHGTGKLSLPLRLLKPRDLLLPCCPRSAGSLQRPCRAWLSLAPPVALEVAPTTRQPLEGRF